MPSRVLLIALGGGAAAECTLLAATARAHAAKGADGGPLKIVMMTDGIAGRLLGAAENSVARALFDSVLPLPPHECE